jgi:multiple sugar transport system substrate-binding protein
MNAKTRHIAAAVAIAGALTLSACTPAGEQPAENQKLTVWTLERQPDRVEIQKKIAADFTQQSGVEVDVVAVDEAQYNQLLVSSAASGELPDVIGGLGLPGVGALQANDLLDGDAAARVVDDLGRDTFAPRSLELASKDGQQLAVPGDSWASVLVYRKDLFDKAGLKAPETYDDIMKAAQALTSDGRVGFSGFTTNQETFEHLALANGCQLVDNDQKIRLESPECVESFTFYRELMTKYSVPGEQDTNTARSNYLSGRSAMTMFSSFILDELAGLRKDMLPSCAECAGDPGYLAKNTGVVTAIKGPKGSAPAQFGSQVNWAIPVEAAPAAADFVKYMMSDGYERWLAFAPEGKVPARQGTKGQPTAYVDAWKALPSGTTTKAPLSKFYPQSVIQQLTESPEKMSLWAVPQGQGALAGALLAEQPVAKAINSMVTGGTSGPDAAKNAADAARTIQSTLK